MTLAFISHPPSSALSSQTRSTHARPPFLSLPCIIPALFAIAHPPTTPSPPLSLLSSSYPLSPAFFLSPRQGVCSSFPTSRSRDWLLTLARRPRNTSVPFTYLFPRPGVRRHLTHLPTKTSLIHLVSGITELLISLAQLRPSLDLQRPLTFTSLQAIIPRKLSHCHLPGVCCFCPHAHCLQLAQFVRESAPPFCFPSCLPHPTQLNHSSHDCVACASQSFATCLSLLTAPPSLSQASRIPSIRIFFPLQRLSVGPRACVLSRLIPLSSSTCYPYVRVDWTSTVANISGLQAKHPLPHTYAGSLRQVAVFPRLHQIPLVNLFFLPILLSSIA